MKPLCFRTRIARLLSRLVINFKTSFDILPQTLVLVLSKEGQRCLEIYKVLCFAFEQLNDLNKAPIYDPNASSTIKALPACSFSVEGNFSSALALISLFNALDSAAERSKNENV